MMSPEDRLQKTLRVTYDLVDRLSSQKAVSEALSLTDGQVSRLLSGSRKISLEETFRLLDFLDVSPRLVIETVCEAEPVTPVELLRVLRRNPDVRSQTFLAEVEVRLPEPRVGPLARGATSTFRQRLLELEGERFKDAAAVKEQLEGLVLEWLRKETRPPELLGDVATALAIWASIQRVRDRHDEACTAYIHAFNLMNGIYDPWVLGLLHLKVASLLKVLQRARKGIEFLKEALILFVQADDSRFQARVFVDLGIFHNSLGEFEKAEMWHERGLQQLPASDGFYRFCAYLDLAWGQYRSGDLLSAEHNLSKARQLQPKDNYCESLLWWTQGDISRKLGATDAAEAAFREARAIFLSQSRLVEACQVSLILAQTLYDARRTEPLRELVIDLQYLAKKLKNHPAAVDVIEKLALQFYRTKGGPKLFEQALHEFGAALATPRGRSRPT